jgi:hypothetical protein
MTNTMQESDIFFLFGLFNDTLSTENIIQRECNV